MTTNKYTRKQTDVIYKALRSLSDPIRSAVCDDGCVRAININDRDQAFTSQIFNRSKIIETRTADVFKSLVGQRVAIIRTGLGAAECVGFVDIVGVKYYTTRTAFDRDKSLHLVTGGKYDFPTGGMKYGYILNNPVRCTPFKVTALGNVIRRLPTATIPAENLHAMNAN